MSSGRCKPKQWDATTALLKWAKSRTLMAPVLARIWSNRHSHTLLRGTQNGRATLEDTLVLSYKMKALLWSFIHSFRLLSCVRLFETPWTAARQASLSITNSQSLLKLLPTESVMPSNHLILCCPLLLPPSIFPTIRVFSNESAIRIRWPKYWSFSFNISPSNEYSGLIFFRTDWFDLLSLQGTLMSLLQHHSSKASILWRSGFFHSPTLTSIHEHWKNHNLD